MKLRQNNTHFESDSTSERIVAPVVVYPDIDEAIRICSEASDIVSSLTPRVTNLETGKQDELVSGTNIKTINGQSVLGSGNILIESGGTDLPTYPTTNGDYLLKLNVASGTSTLSWDNDVATFDETEGGVTLA